MADKRLVNAFKEAAEIARAVPKEFQKAAFDRALDALLKEETGGRGKSPMDDDAPDRTAGSTERLIAASVDTLNLAIGKLGIEGKSAEEIAEILEQRLGIRADNRLIAAVLAQSDKIVDRVGGGGAALLSLIARGAGLDSPEPEPAPKSAKGKTKSKGGKKSAGKRGRKSADPPPSAAQVLNDLIARGFFSTARTVTDVLLYLQRKGLEITARELYPLLMRLIQAGILSRAKSSSGAYEYRAK